MHVLAQTFNKKTLRLIMCLTARKERKSGINLALVSHTVCHMISVSIHRTKVSKFTDHKRADIRFVNYLYAEMNGA